LTKAPAKVAKQYVEVTDWQVGQLWAYRLRSGRYVVFRVKERRNDFMTGGGVLPFVEVLDRVWEDLPGEPDAAKAKARTPSSGHHSPDDPTRPSNELLLMRATRTDYPADRLTLIGQVDPNPRRGLAAVLRRRGPGDSELMPALWPWKFLDRELAETWALE
jgi:hypothetical protein